MSLGKSDFIEDVYYPSSRVAKPGSDIAGLAGLGLESRVEQVTAHIAAPPGSGVWPQLVGRGESALSNHAP